MKSIKWKNHVKKIDGKNSKVAHFSKALQELFDQQFSV